MWLPDRYEPARLSFLSSKYVNNEDKNTVAKLVDKLLATKIQKHRASKYYIYLRLIIERGWLQTYTNVTEEQLYHFLSIVEHETNISHEAKRDYKTCLKRILEFQGNPLYTTIKTAEPPRELPQYFPTAHDILKIVKSDRVCLRDKAIASCLLESGGRPHEFFLLKLEDVLFEKVHGKLKRGDKETPVDLDLAKLKINREAKTGARIIPLMFSVPWLKAWIAERQSYNHNGNRFLWTEIAGARKGEQIRYPAANKAMKHALAVAGVENWKKMSLYKFRHGRQTEACQHLSYAEHCVYAGWYQGSDMPRVYNHLDGKNIMASLLSPYGIVIDKIQDDRQAWVEIMRLGLAQK